MEGEMRSKRKMVTWLTGLLKGECIIRWYPK